MIPTVLIACSFVSRLSNIAEAPPLKARRMTIATLAHRTLSCMVLLPNLDVEGVGGAEAARGLVDRTPRGRERAVRGVAEQPIVLDKGMNLPLRIDLILHLHAGAGRVRSAHRVEYGKPRRHHLRGIDAEIGRDRLGALPCEARAARNGDRPSDRHDEIRREFGNNAAMAAKPRARLVAQAKPVDRKIFDEPTEFERGIDVPETKEFGMAVLQPRRHELGGGAGTKIAEIDQRDAGAVARAAKLIGGAGT